MLIKRVDYLKHFIAGYMVTYPCFDANAWWWSLGVTTMVAGGKECYDLITGKGTPEVGDFFSTLGGFAVVALIEGIKSLIL